MGALQKVNLGTAPTGTDGDTVRTANTKANTNVDLLNAQAALTSAPAVTVAQALTAAHIGKRVNINLAAAGVINMPAANVAAADNVLLLRNVGTTIATLAITPNSGDTVALSRLNPGESALFDTDGVHAWTALMRGRTNSDNETVNGNCAVGGNETVGGTLGVTGNTTVGGTLGVTGNATVGGGLTVSGAAGLNVSGAGGLIFPDSTVLKTAFLAPVAQCRLILSGSNLVLSRLNGSYLTIGGIAQQIPAAGVSLAPTGLVATTVYYVYAYMASGVMTLVADTLAPAIDATTGVQVKSGAPGYSLVGMVYLATGGTFAACAMTTYFNRQGQSTNTSGSGSAQVATPWFGSGCLLWGDESLALSATGYASTPSAGNTSTVYFVRDGAQTGNAIQYSNITGGFAFPISLSVTSTPSIGYHSFALWGKNDGQLLTMTATMSAAWRG